MRRLEALPSRVLWGVFGFGFLVWLAFIWRGAILDKATAVVGLAIAMYALMLLRRRPRRGRDDLRTRRATADYGEDGDRAQA